MTSIRQSLEINKRILIAIAVMIAVFSAFMFKFYFNQKRENRALRIKILSMQENRRTPKPWAQLLEKPQSSTSALAAPAIAPTAPAQKQNITATTPAEINQTIDSQDTQELAMKLTTGMRRVKTLEVADIDNNIAIADEIISREPDSYGAYKAKLISLLTKEGKFNQAVDEAEVESILESMAQFNISSDKIARREAALIANTNSDIQNAETQLGEVARQRETLEAQLNTFDPNSQEFANLNAQLQQLDEQEIRLASNIETLENNLANNTAQLTNEDIVEIPFMRMMAKSDYDGVIDNAQAFIEQFPNSPNGYFYMVKALEMQGQKDQALQVIQSSRLPQDAQQNLLERLDAQAAEDPKNYWQKLSF